MSGGIYAKVLLDSISPESVRLTTFEVKFHRFILAEFNTHRMFSRNFRSSRAVPTARLIQEVETNPATPVFWGKNQKGMQAQEELYGLDRHSVEREWSIAATGAAHHARRMMEYGAHKQIVNRLLEPFLYVYGVVSATEFDNFFGLRLDAAAQPEIRVLAEKMWEARRGSVPRPLGHREWHLPYVTDAELADMPFLNARLTSVARCARVTQFSFDTGRHSTFDEDASLYRKLVGSQPLHASPLEHQAQPDAKFSSFSSRQTVTVPAIPTPHDRWDTWLNPHLQGNFVGWIQHRKLLQGEAIAPLPPEYR